MSIFAENNKDMRLKELLKEKHMSGTELAKQLGVSSSYINAVALGKTNVSIKKCEEIAKILDIPMAALFDGYCKPGFTYCPYCGKPIGLCKD